MILKKLCEFRSGCSICFMKSTILIVVGFLFCMPLWSGAQSAFVSTYTATPISSGNTVSSSVTCCYALSAVITAPNTGFASRFGVDDQGELCVAVNGGDLRRYQSDAVTYTSFGLNESYPSFGSLDVDSKGNVYVLSANLCHAVEFGSNNALYTQWMSCGNGKAVYSGTGDIAVDRSDSNNVFVVDRNTGRVQEFRHDSTTPTLMRWVAAWETGLANRTFGITTDRSGLVYLSAESQIYVYKVIGTTANLVSSSPWDASGVGGADDIAADNNGYLYTVSSETGSISIWDLTGKVLCTFTAPGTNPGRLNHPNGIAVGSDGNVWVRDEHGTRIQKFSPCVSAVSTNTPTPTENADETEGVLSDAEAQAIKSAQNTGSGLDAEMLKRWNGLSDDVKSKLGTGLMQLLVRKQVSGMTDLSKFIDVTEKNNVRYAGVFIETTGKDPGLASLGAINVHGYSKHFFVARVPVDRLLDLALMSSVLKIEPAYMQQLTLNKSLAETGVEAVHNNCGLMGKGVVVGILDTGLDVNHHDFETGTPGISSNVAWYYDEPAGSAVYGVNEWDSALLNTTVGRQSAMATAPDEEGHGTHVAGIAAGTGLAVDGGISYIGVAPESTLVDVKIFTGSYTSSTDIYNGLDYVFNTRAPSSSAVVNMSLGQWQGSHDDSSVYEQTVDSFVSNSPAHVVVVAQGNDGARPWHRRGTTKTGVNQFSQATYKTTNYYSHEIDGWYNSPSLANIQVIATGTGGGTLTLPANWGWAAIGGFVSGAYVYIYQNPLNCARNFQIEIYPLASTGIRNWQIKISNSASAACTYDMWTGSAEETAGFYPNTTTGTLNVPATASKVIAVGSYVTNPQTACYTPTTLGALSDFSGQGPTREGCPGYSSRVKPDIAAPGECIWSARSSQMTSAPPCASTSLHMLDLGTSMAAPHVTGLVALWMQADLATAPYTTSYTSVMNHLTTTSLHYPASSSRPNNQFGYGKMRASCLTAPTYTPTVTNTRTVTNTPTVTSTKTNTRTPTSTRTPTFTRTITNTRTVTNTPTVTNTKTDTRTPTSTRTPTFTRTITNTRTVTNTRTITNTPTVTNSKTDTGTPTWSRTQTFTKTVTPTLTATNTKTDTETPTPTRTWTETPTFTSTQTDTFTLTATWIATDTQTWTETPTSSETSTDMLTPTPSETSTSTDTLTSTMTFTATSTPTVFMTPTCSGGVGTPGQSWAESSVDTGMRTMYHTSVEFNGKMWVIGPKRSSYPVNEGVWSSVDGATWNLDVANPPFAISQARMQHTSLAFNSQLWVIGGDSNGTPMNDVWSSPDGLTWSPITTGAIFAPRFGHASVVFNSKMWVIGGKDYSGNYYNDVWSSADGSTWNLETSSPGFTGRYGHVCVVFNGEMWLLGGLSGTTGTQSEIWHSPDGINWSLATGTMPHGGTAGFTAVVYNSRIYIMGYFEVSGGVGGNVWSSVDGTTWVPETNYYPYFSNRFDHSSVVYDNRMWVIGGTTSALPISDAWYSPGCN